MNTLQKAVLTLGAAAVTLCAQGLEKNVAFQFVTTSDAQPATMALRVDSFGGKPVTGKPFSATEVRRTRQTLGDGTHIDKAEKDKYFRDHEGRTRIEREDGATVIITDPSSGATSETSKGRSKVMMLRSSGFSTSSAVSAGGEKAITINNVGPELHTEMLDKVRAEGAATAGYRVMTNDVTRVVTALPAMQADKGTTEDLGDQIVNGVMARGTRSTITIPVGQIGNDREIKVISERWFSSDLGVLIKSTNNDPRFGETTYELTDILQGAQDPTLFQSPKHE